MDSSTAHLDGHALDIPTLNQKLTGASPRAILDWVWHTFDRRVVASSSFQTQSVPLLHFISQAVPQMPVLFVDTGFHFPETLAYRDQLSTQFNLNLEIVRPEIYGQEFVESFGEMHQQNPDACCLYNKTTPLNTRLKAAKAWVSGIRRDQTKRRSTAEIIEIPPTLQLVKVNPMVAWTAMEICAYIERHGLPRHPLWAQGYRSIGCKPCTSPTRVEENPREGRWRGQPKSECGMHTQE